MQNNSRNHGSWIKDAKNWNTSFIRFRSLIFKAPILHWLRCSRNILTTSSKYFVNIFSWYFQEFSCTCVDEMIFGSGRYLSLWMETFNKIFSFPAQHFLFENHFLKQSCSEFNFHQFVCHITLNSLFNLSLYQYIVRYTVQALGPMIPRKRHSPVSMLAV